MTKGKKIALGVFIAGGAIGMLVSLGIAQMIHMTGDDKFCVSCHVMEPMRDAYLNDIHGGKNRVGVKADCVACHLPHDNVLNYVFRKAYNGATEAAAMVFLIRINMIGRCVVKIANILFMILAVYPVIKS
jgi:putative tetraheme cytochrome c